MRLEDAPEFLSQLIALAELFDATLSETKQQLYFQALSDIDFINVTQGMTQAARYCQFMPRPVEIRDLAIGKEHDRAEQVWLDFRSDIVRLGGYRAREWNPPRWVESAVEEVFGSFRDACECELSPEMWQAKKKEFMRSYIEGLRIEADDNALKLPPAHDVKQLK